MRRWGAVMLLCTARRAVALLKPLRRQPTRRYALLPGASDYHVPVLGNECIEWLARDDGVFVDCTLGGGGHSSLLLFNNSQLGFNFLILSLAESILRLPMVFVS